MFIKKRLTKFVGMIGLVGAMPFAFAQPINTPLTIESDSAQIDHQGQTATHIGQVIVHMDNSWIFADKLVITRSAKGHVEKMVATGHPARFETQIDAHPKINGHALTITFFPKPQEIILKGEGFLKQGKDSFQSHQIYFNLETKMAKTIQSKGKRTKLVIYPGEL